MDKLPNHIENLTPEMMDAYINGKLSNEDMHRLEKFMLDSSFDSEAMEGFEQNDGDHLGNIKALKDQIDSRTNHNDRFIILKIAAAVVLLAVTTWLVIDYTSENMSKSELVLENTVEDVTQDNLDDADAGVLEEQAENKIAEDKSIIETKEPTIAQEESVEIESYQEEDEHFERDQDAELLTVSDQANVEVDEELAIEDFAMVMTEAEVAETTNVKSAKTEMANYPARAQESIDVRDQRLAKALSEKVAGITTSGTSIKGQVTSSEDGNPLPGVNVVVKGSTRGTVTDMDGRYILDSVSADDKLVFSFIGLASTEVKKGSRSTIDMTMESDAEQLSEVIVTGYGKQSVENTTSQILPAKPKDGMSALKAYLKSHLADSASQEDRCIVQFTVSQDGRLSDFKFKKPDNDSLRHEIIRLLQNGPEWQPATVDGIKKPDQVKIRLRY